MLVRDVRGSDLGGCSGPGANSKRSAESVEKEMITLREVVKGGLLAFSP